MNATLNGADVDLSWTPATPTPSNYKLFRNGILILNTASNTTYTDVSPWPNTYNYVVRAGYGTQGYTRASNTATVQIAGGVARNLVLYEKGTGTWCPYCPGAAMGIRDLIEVNNKLATAIGYHSGDAYENIDATQRIGYYAIEAFPTTLVDGIIRHEGGSATQSLYPIYLQSYNKRYPVPGLQNININIVGTGMNTYTATVTVEETYPHLTSGLTLHTALTESNIPQNWQNQTEVDYVLRKMYPDAAGTALDFSQNMTQTFQFNLDLTGFVKNNCEFVVFIQHDATQEVTQTAMVKMSTVTGMEELMGNSIGIYPNPASDYITFNSNGNGTLSITDLAGKTLYTFNIQKEKQLVPVHMLPKGMYLIQYTNHQRSFTEKLIIK